MTEGPGIQGLDDRAKIAGVSQGVGDEGEQVRWLVWANESDITSDTG